MPPAKGRLKSAKDKIAETIATDAVEPPKKSRAPSAAPKNTTNEVVSSTDKSDVSLKSSDAENDHFDEGLVSEEVVVVKQTKEEEKNEQTHPELQNPTISSILNASNDDNAKVLVYLLPHEITLFERPDLLAERIRATLTSMENLLTSGFLDNKPNKVWLLTAQRQLQEVLTRYDKGEIVEPEAYKGAELGELVEVDQLPSYVEFEPEKNPTTEKPVLVDDNFGSNKNVLLNYFSIEKDEDLPDKIVTDEFVSNLPLHVDFITSGRETKNFPDKEKKAFDKRVNDYATYLRDENNDTLGKFAAALAIYREFNDAFEKKFHKGVSPNEDKNTIHPLLITWNSKVEGGKFNNKVADVMDEIDKLATLYRRFMRSDEEFEPSKRRFLTLNGDTLFAVPYVDKNGNISLDKEGRYKYVTKTEDLPYETGSITTEILNEIAEVIDLYTKGKVTFNETDSKQGYVTREQIRDLWTRVSGEDAESSEVSEVMTASVKDVDNYEPNTEITESTTANPSTTQTSEETRDLTKQIINRLKNSSRENLVRVLQEAGIELPTKYSVSEVTNTKATHEDLSRARTPPPQTSELSTRDDIYTDQVTARDQPKQNAEELVRTLTPVPMTSVLSSRDDIATDQLTTRPRYDQAVQKMGNAIIIGDSDKATRVIQESFSLGPREHSVSGFGGSEISLVPNALPNNEFLQKIFQEIEGVLKQNNTALPDSLMDKVNVTIDFIKNSWKTVNSLTAEAKSTQNKNISLGKQLEELMVHNNQLQTSLQELISKKDINNSELNKILNETQAQLTNINNSYNALHNNYEQTKLQLRTALANERTMESRLQSTNRNLERAQNKIVELLKRFKTNNIVRFIHDIKKQKNEIGQFVRHLRSEIAQKDEQFNSNYNELNQAIQRLGSVSQQPGPAADDETVNAMKAELEAKNNRVWELMTIINELEKQSLGAAEVLAGLKKNYEEHIQNQTDNEAQTENVYEEMVFFNQIIQELENENRELGELNKSQRQRIEELDGLLNHQILEAEENLKKVSEELTEDYQKQIEELKEKLYNKDARLLNRLANEKALNQEKERHRRTVSEMSRDDYAKMTDEWFRREQLRHQLSNERYAYQKKVDDRSADRREKRKANARASAAKDKLTSRVIMNNRFADLLMKLTGTGNPELMAYATGMFYDFLKSAANLSDEELAARDIDKIINMYDNGAIGRMVAAIGSQKQSSVEDSLSKRISDLENTTRNFISLVSQRTAHVGAAAAYHPPRRVFVGRNGVAYQGNRRARTSKSPRRAPPRKTNGQFKRKAKK